MSDTNGKKKSKGGVWQFIKFALFSASAGIRTDVFDCTYFVGAVEFHIQQKVHF